MKKQNRRKLIAGLGLLGIFVLWTVMVRSVDVQTIGPEGSAVGFAAVNGFVHGLTGVHWSLYTITDWLGLIPVCCMLGFAMLGLAQWVGRKHISRVDHSILALGGFYVAVTAAYLFFETYVVNYRPVLVNNVLEASYPSSTTLLVLTVMPTTVKQLNARIRKPVVRRGAAFALNCFTGFMVIGRLVSGVHWMTDIIGGVLLSAGLVLLYDFALGMGQKER